MACLSITSIISISNQSVGLVSTPNFCNTETIAKHSDSYSSSVSSILLIPTSSSSIRNKLRLRSQRRRTSPSTSHHSQRLGLVRAASSETMATEKLGIKILTNPPESKLTDLGVRSWPKWGCPPSKFPWTYSSKEMCYLLKGKVKVYPEGCDEGVEIGAGDLVVFPKGMSCTWDVSETVDKHYNFE